MEKSRIAEEESMLLTQKASEAEQECQRAHIISAKTQEEKVVMEHKVGGGGRGGRIWKDEQMRVYVMI